MHQNKTVVVKYGGNAMTEARLKEGFARDILALQQAGIQPVIVHGGGPQIDGALKKIGKQTTFVQGMRITDQETMQVVEWVLGGQIQQEIVLQINHCGGQAVGLTGKDGGLLNARRWRLPDHARAGEFIDIGQVGEVESVQPAVLEVLQKNSFIPVISPIGFDHAGRSYNINADGVAGKLAMALNADALLIMSNIAGVLDAQGQLLTELRTTDIDVHLEAGALAGGMLPKIAAVLEAVQSGVPSVQIVDGRIEHVVLRTILHGQSLGTAIRA